MTTTTWNIDTTHSGIHFSVRHMVFAKVRGRFASWKGTVGLTNGELGEGTVDVTIDAASIDTGVADRDAHLRSADFLDVASFPELRFTGTRVEKSAAGFRLHGNLAIRGVTREVALDVVQAGRAKDPWGHQRIAFTATTSLDRRDFGLTWNQLLEAGGVLVGDKIEVELEIQAVEAASSQAA